MKQRLAKLSDLAIKLNGTECLLHSPASDDDIKALEARLNVTLPADYKVFLTVTDGLESAIDTEPRFLSATDVNYLKEVDSETIAIWRETGNDEVADALETSILVAGQDEEQMFLLIPPSEQTADWQYWKFAHWIPGEEAYDDLATYFGDVITFMEYELTSL